MKFEYVNIHPINDLTENENNIYVMREDLLPFALGGNKVRIASEFLDDMKRKDCDTMIAYGSVKSNLCRVIANLCFRENIPCYIICALEDGETDTQNSNGQMVKIFQAKIVYCKKNSISDTVEKLMCQLVNEGKRPYYIYGNKYGVGNEGVPTAAYAKAYPMIKLFEKQNQMLFDYIFFASGTGATQAGLTCGHILAKDQVKIAGILISSREFERARLIIRDGMKSYLKKQNLIWEDGYDQEIMLLDDYKKGGYGKYDEEILACIRRELAINSLPLDPIYTGKAFWGMEQYIREQHIHDKNILFIHTGGTPLFYDALLNDDI